MLAWHKHRESRCLPLLHPPRPVLDRLCQMRRANLLLSRQVGDRAGELEYTVVAARREVQLAHGGLHQRLARAIQLTVRAQLGGAHGGVAVRVRQREARCTV